MPSPSIKRQICITDLSIFPPINWKSVMGINIKEENILVRMEQPGSAHQLAIFRILLGLQIIYSSSAKIFQYVLQVPDISNTKNIFPAWLNQWVDVIAVPYLQPLTQ